MNIFRNSKKLVIKIGSSLLTNDKGSVNKTILKNVVNDISFLINQGKDIVVVSSGAIALGRGKLNLNRELTLHESQAAAARGRKCRVGAAL